MLVNKFINRFSEPERGDIVDFESVEQSDKHLIKRVIGVEGDEISVRCSELLVNGEPQPEPYVNKKSPFPFENFSSARPVPKDHVFVMGDYRDNSYDSRRFGPVPEKT